MTDHDIHDNTVDDDTLTRLLRTHDVAPADTTALREQLDARLADPTTSFTSPPTPITAAALPRRRLTPVRVGGMVAAAAVAALAWTMLPGPSDGSAYASWTATAQAVADRDRNTAVRECRDALRGPFWARNEGGPEQFDPQAATVALTERRGDLVSVLLRDEGARKDFSGFCVVTLKQGATSGTVEAQALGGAVGGPPGIAPATGFLEGSMSQSGQDPISMIDGAVGQDVAALTIHAGELSVQATIEDGRYAAWIPGRIFPDEDPGRSGQGGPEPVLTYDLTLTDGTTITNAPPAHP